MCPLQSCVFVLFLMAWNLMKIEGLALTDHSPVGYSDSRWYLCQRSLLVGNPALPESHERPAYPPRLSQLLFPLPSLIYSCAHYPQHTLPETMLFPGGTWHSVCTFANSPLISFCRCLLGLRSPIFANISVPIAGADCLLWEYISTQQTGITVAYI